jgi:hypothetical protein
MKELQIIYQNQEKIIKKLNTGDVDATELSVEQITDEFMIYGLRSGLISRRGTKQNTPFNGDVIRKIILTPEN